MTLLFSSLLSVILKKLAQNMYIGYKVYNKGWKQKIVPSIFEAEKAEYMAVSIAGNGFIIVQLTSFRFKRDENINHRNNNYEYS